MSFVHACNGTDVDTQIIAGLTKDNQFELYPFGMSMTRCITQGHHPKPKESIVGQHCGDPRFDHTNEWQVYEPIQAYRQRQSLGSLGTM
jgi:hypothetical protein